MNRRTDNSKKTESRKDDILKASYELFIKQGYTKSGMRQIAKKADVSLGLASYHFDSKREIAAEILKRKFTQFADTVRKYVSLTENPLLYSALLVNLNYTVLSSEKFLPFYKDSLRDDILMEVIIRSGSETFLSIRDKYQPDLSDETARQMAWYGNHISVSMERTLVLYTGDYFYPKSIPEIIFHSYIDLWHFPRREALAAEAISESKVLAVRILDEHPELFD